MNIKLLISSVSELVTLAKPPMDFCFLIGRLPLIHSSFAKRASPSPDLAPSPSQIPLDDFPQLNLEGVISKNPLATVLQMNKTVSI